MAQQQESPSADAVDGTATNGKRSGKTFLVVLVAVVLASLGGGAVAAFFLQPQAAAMMAGGSSDVVDIDEGEEAAVEYGEFMEIHGIIVNPANSGGGQFLMVNVGLEGADASVMEAVSAREIVVRDRILRLLSSRTARELSDITLRDSIKTEILTSVNSILDEKQVSRLYFTQYVLQ